MAAKPRESATTDARPVLQLAHSPDPDDAFMWWPLFDTGSKGTRIETGRFRYEPVMDDIESLNRAAETGEYEITAMSCAQYPKVAHRYAITACGSSMGDGYGPKLIATRAISVDELRSEDVVIAVPGTRTSAFATLSMLVGPGSFRYEVVEFDRIIQATASGEYAAGVVIHEGQLTFAAAGLHLVQDLGGWWRDRTGLPLPLGVNAVRRDLEEQHGEGTLAEIAETLLRSVEFALAHRADSIDYARQFGRGIDLSLTDEFVGLYVNRWTVDFGPTGRRAVDVFLREVAAAGLTPSVQPLTCIGADTNPASAAAQQRQTSNT